MIDTIYIEEQIEGLSKYQEILSRFPKATVITCTHYKEIFNPSAQSFRLQKRNRHLFWPSKPGN